MNLLIFGDKFFIIGSNLKNFMKISLNYEWIDLINNLIYMWIPWINKTFPTIRSSLFLPPYLFSMH